LSTTVTAAGSTWAVAVAGGPAANEDNFWQLLVRPETSRTWRLVTPPGVASTGGLVIAPLGGGSLTAAFRPSQSLAFTPLATTSDLGRRWSAGVLDAGLANSPAALAADPATGHMLALLSSGKVEQSSDRGMAWSMLTSLPVIRQTGTGRRCELAGLTAVAFTKAGAPLIAGRCAHAGIVPVFTLTGQGWHSAGPAPASSGDGHPVTVLALSTVGSGRTLAVLQQGSGQAGMLTAAWSPTRGDGTGSWLVSPPVSLRGRTAQSVAAGSNGALALVLSGRAGFFEAGPGAAWQKLPELPAGTQVLAIGPGAAIEALSPAGAKITVWSASPPGVGWTMAQEVRVPIQSGSSS
jgi:hypothetical protein